MRQTIPLARVLLSLSVLMTDPQYHRRAYRGFQRAARHAPTRAFRYILEEGIEMKARAGWLPILGVRRPSVCDESVIRFLPRLSAWFSEQRPSVAAKWGRKNR